MPLYLHEKMACNCNGAFGLFFKEFLDVFDVRRDGSKTLPADLGVPVIYGLSFGHIRDQFTLPVGIEAELDTEKATMTLLETGVV